MAARREPRPAALRSHPRHRRRHQERTLPPDPRLRRRRGRGALLLDRNPRDRASRDRVLVFYEAPWSPRSPATGYQKRRSCAPRWVRRRRGGRLDRAQRSDRGASRQRLPWPPLKRLARQRGLAIAIAVFLILLAVIASIGAVRLSLLRPVADGRERRHAGSGGDRPDYRRAHRRLRSLGGRRDLARQCHAGFLPAGSARCRRWSWWPRASASAWSRARSTASSSRCCACSRSS